MAAEHRQCPRCKNFDSLKPLVDDTAGDAKWSEHDGQMFAVQQFRCEACGLSDLVERDFRLAHEQVKPVPGRALPSDGRMFVVHPIDKPPTRQEVTR